MFCILKPLLKSKSNIRKFSAHFTLIFILDIILFYFNSVFSFFSCIAINKSTSYLRLLKKLPKTVKVIILLSFCLPNLLLCCVDIEKNPCPKYSSLKFCRWNLSGLTAHDSIKISLLRAYIIQNNYDIICLSETFLNSSIQTNDDRISIDGYNLIRADHPSDSKRGGVCIYYKEHIPLIKREDICTLDNCLVTEIRSEGEKCFLTCVFRSPSQNHDEFKDFRTKFDLFMSNINNNSHYVQLSQVILMLDAQGGGKMTLLTQQGKKLTLSHHQLDINKLLINLPMLLITLCHALTSYFVQTRM